MTDQLKQALNNAKTTQADTPGSLERRAQEHGAQGHGVQEHAAQEQSFDMSESSYKTTHTAVRKARRFAMQGLYEWLVTDRRFETTDKLGWKDNAPHDIAARTRATNAMHTVHIGYYHEMMRDIPEQIETLNALIEQHLDRNIDKLDTVEHAILLIGTYELQNRLEIPYKVVLDEAMKLNNHFGATDAHKLINAVLDKMAVELRALEVQADTAANKRTSQKAATKTASTADTNNTDTNNTDSHGETAVIADKPTASNKSRISANNVSVKRNSASKAKANISDFKASKQSDAEKDRTETQAVKKESVIDDKSIVDTATVDNDNVENNTDANAESNTDSSAADIGLTNSNLVNPDEKSQD